MNVEKKDIWKGRFLMKIFRFVLIPVITGFILAGCVGYLEKEKYRRPDWLAGKLYTQITQEEELKEFAECLRLTGWDTILDVSGVYTVFAPSDEAMDRFLSENQFSGISDIPIDELTRLVKYHIVQNPWSEEQLQSLNMNGWVDPQDPFSRPNAYKRQTVLKYPDEKYWVKRYKGRDMIIMDSTAASGYKRVFTKSRKYVPIFFDEFFDIYGLSYEDYSFFFNRPYESGNIYFAGAKVTKSQIIAENGFIYIIDKCEKPLPNAKEMLERKRDGDSYRRFLDLVYRHYATFDVNLAATQSQYALRYGGIVDTLWDLSFLELPFDIQEEMTGDRTYQESRFTLSTQYGMVVPTDDAFKVFLDGTLTAKSGYPHWPQIAVVPRDVIDIILSPHFFRHPLYKSNIEDVIINDELLDEQQIIHREFGSNCTFFGVDSYTPSKVFTSVTGPAFLRSNFTLFRHALQYTNLDEMVSGLTGAYILFLITDGSLHEEESLIIQYNNAEQTSFSFSAFDQFSGNTVSLPSWVLSTFIINHIGTSLPNGSANKEFIRTLGGNYIILDHANNTIQGNTPCTFGYNGDSVITCHPTPLPEPANNGETWYTTSWLNYLNPDITLVLPRFPTFVNLLERAGLAPPNSNRITSLQYNQYYTIFIPSDQALQNFQVDTLSDEQLRNFLLYHIVRGSLIFTDNKASPGDFPTLSPGEASTPENPVYSTLNIRPGPDLIEILDSAGSPYVSIPEEKGVTNILVSTNTRVTTVIHQIDQVLIKQ